MGFIEFIEKVCGIELRDYQKQYLLTMENLWEQGYTFVWLNGRAVVIPRKGVTNERKNV